MPLDHRIYSHARYDALLKAVTKQIQELSELKGGEYAGDVDRLANFRRNADRLGVSMETVWAVYTAKHIDAIMQYVQDLASSRSRTRMETIASRAYDIIVYMILFIAMEDERRNGTATPRETAKPLPKTSDS